MLLLSDSSLLELGLVTCLAFPAYLGLDKIIDSPDEIVVDVGTVKMF